MTVKPPALHPGQEEIAKSPARYKVVCCGRRWGKTRMGVYLSLVMATNGKRCWWVAPDFQRANEGFELLWSLASHFPRAERHKSERRITIGAGRAEVRSADDPNQLRGAGLDLVVLDEASFMQEAAWSILRPSLAERKGRALFISTPNGRNWFYRLFQRGNDPLYPNWRSWQKPTSDNPYIDPEEIEEARRDTPEMVFAQEYLAAFTEDRGAVFRRIREAVYGPLGMYLPSSEYRETQSYVAGHYQTVLEYAPHAGQYVMGVDWGMSNDFTALVVVDTNNGLVVDFERFNQLSWQFQRDRVMSMARKWHVETTLAEANSIGDPNIEQLRKDGLEVRPIQTTNASKTDYIRALVLAFEQGTIKIPEDPVLIGELEAYEVERLESGKYRYGAPPGAHDDTVIALALAWKGRRDGSRVATQQPFLR